MNMLQRLKEYGFDFEPLGLLPADDSDRHFCTPADAEILFRTGVDGIHYCQIQGFGDMVFAVEPMGNVGDMVYPVAESIENFLRLVIACGGEAAVQQCRYWDRMQFDAFLTDYPPTPQQQSCIQRLIGEWKLSPMDDPYGYVSIVQNGFDGSERIAFTEEYYDILGLEPPTVQEPAWTVTYTDGIFSQSPRGDDVGTELSLGISFQWADREWYIPSVYICREGLVADVCQRAEPAALQRFIERWNLLENDGRDVFTEEQELQIRQENPLGFDYRTEIMVNGDVLPSARASGVSWNPCVPDAYYHGSDGVKWILDHYGMDAAYGWSIRRICYPWQNGRPTRIDDLTMTVSPRRTEYIGGRFVGTVGDTVHIEHPISKEVYALKICELEQHTLERRHLPDDDTIFPLCYTAIIYEVTPPVDKKRIQLRDTCRGDSPIRKGQANGHIGCGVSAIALLRDDSAHHTALSALTFVPREAVEWCVVFHEVEYMPDTVTLI